MSEDISKYKPQDNECEKEYADRIKNSYLPHFPEDALIQWFHRHYDHLDDYAWLDFKTLSFDLQEWNLNKIPGHECFADENWSTFASNFPERVKDPLVDWLARYMNENKTWNQPIILLDNPNGITSPSGIKLKQPYHLLEGHRRLSFLCYLREQDEAKMKHEILLTKKV